MISLSGGEVVVELPALPDVVVTPPAAGGQVFVPMVGPTGLSAYEQAVQEGFVGTEAQWLESLRGGDGTFVKLLEANEPVPGNLAPGTIILRKSPD